ncbi:MAG: M23 family metallopeptidase, partial [bacterium]|nr:M23 family metallopeptidase [bacterium]
KKSKVLKKYREAFKKGSLQEKIQALQECIEEIRASINQHYAKTIHNKARFAATPSIWPVYGRIRSGYGWRRHPILGKRFFHKGIDIPSWTGAPIKATADGIIKYAGWSGAFGNVVVIDHNFGFRTIYAHALQILVIRGSFVKKGQVIAQVGSTGLSTGAHVHYEIRRWDKAVNPRYYLDLDMFTASTRMW